MTGARTMPCLVDAGIVESAPSGSKEEPDRRRREKNSSGRKRPDPE
jgi:hypothetical protein